jgi:heme exporter protein CcmD
MSGPYAFYVWTAYGVSALALLGVAVWTARGWLRARAVLARLERAP